MDKLSEFVDHPQQPHIATRFDPALILFALGTIVLITVLASYFWYRTQESKPSLIETKTETYIDTKDNIVDISGAVAKPGVYTMAADERIKDILIKAGGLRPEADAGWVNRSLNLAATLSDGSKLYIPFSGEAPAQAVLGQGQDNACSVNINTATIAQLDTLPGIGEVTAQKILDYRTEHGNFNQSEDIKKVPGIGEKLYVGIQDLICI
jgi:competence protein ComEA